MPKPLGMGKNQLSGKLSLLHTCAGGGTALTQRQPNKMAWLSLNLAILGSAADPGAGHARHAATRGEGGVRTSCKSGDNAACRWLLSPRGRSPWGEAITPVMGQERGKAGARGSRGGVLPPRWRAATRRAARLPQVQMFWGGKCAFCICPLAGQRAQHPPAGHWASWGAGCSLVPGSGLLGPWGAGGGSGRAASQKCQRPQSLLSRSFPRALRSRVLQS